LNLLPFVADRQSASDATDLIESLGADAGSAAAARARSSRDRGNVVHYCRWRQIERLIAVLRDDKGVQTRH